MRAAAIVGLGISTEEVRPFQLGHDNPVLGLPAEATGLDAILVFGGDGTIHRHLPQLVRLGLPLLVVPCGSGNDFAHALKLGSVDRARMAWKRFCEGAGNVRQIDLGIIRELAAEGGNSSSAAHYFCCVGGVGLDGAIARIANRLPRWLRGHGGYALSLPPAVAAFQSPEMELQTSDGKSGYALHSALKRLLVVFANTPFYGDGMKVAPLAQMDDGQLDVCAIREISKAKLSLLFPSVYFGKHLAMKEVEYFKTEALRLATARPMDVYADGEYVCQTPVEVAVAARALTVITP
jgi:diacylglycerol kinase (ATP)